MYNKSGSRNKQNKAIEKTTTEKKRQKDREKKQQKELATFLQCVLFPFLAAIVCNRRKASHAHTHHLTHTHTHTLTSLDSHTHTHTRPQRANALHITAKRAINSKNGGNNVRCAAHNLQHAAHALCVASTAAIP